MKKIELIMPILAGIIIVFSMALIIMLMLIEIPESNEALITQALGTVLALLVMVGGFYFGSSQGSQDKNKMIENNGKK